MSRRRTRPPPKRKSQSPESEAPQVARVETVPAPRLDTAADVDAVTRRGDDLAALDAAWDEV
jgi:hypothetical protein